ncbi:unnamed protein product [Lactuca virosa]|uniref:Uncharacterized protein n=1 Tax=Lactuca virosa TaxID=75947 RepID=A0AAU9NEZ8_9ASTR|nr:unnamed protein product [Lactuca virosa]
MSLHHTQEDDAFFTMRWRQCLETSNGRPGQLMCLLYILKSTKVVHLHLTDCKPKCTYRRSATSHKKPWRGGGEVGRKNGEEREGKSRSKTTQQVGIRGFAQHPMGCGEGKQGSSKTIIEDVWDFGLV